MIQNLEVKGLYGQFDYKFEFFEDFNIFTGQIGTGKTTLLNLIWFLTSGNLHRVISEIPFQFVSICTSEFSLSVEYNDSDQYTLTYRFGKKESKKKFVLDLKKDPSVSETLKQFEELNKRIKLVMKSSLFFPTFRRVERAIGLSKTPENGLQKVADALKQLSSELSVGDHRYIAAVSTDDIIELLTAKRNIISQGEGRTDDDYTTLCERWLGLETWVRDIFEEYYKKILLTDILELECNPKLEVEISSAHLSSGEKQLLGLLSYTVFSEDKTIFIDEPELSMHPDWQRIILYVLGEQGTEKQFFLATHSTMIIGQYETRQFRLMR